ncbi:MAG: hypothetical protein QM703_24200 [Gemmatales bacterium]
MPQRLRAEDESKLKPVVKALEDRFIVTKQRFDSGKRQYVLTLQARETSDQACHYDASFQNADDKEIKTVKLEFDDGGRQTVKGEKYVVTIKYPTRKTMENVTQIVIKKSD